MANPGNQNSQQQTSKNNPNLTPEALQGTDDTQSEFSVGEIRAERREEGDRIDEQSASDAPSKNSNAAETQSEFSVDERLRGKS
jgi:hypothetical protein